MPGYCLTFGECDYKQKETTDKFMISDFIRQRLNSIPLRYGIGKKIIEETRFKLEIENLTSSDLPIYSGDLKVVSGPSPGIIYCPAHILGFIQPGRTILIENIRFIEGLGKTMPFLQRR